jgi:hypothetical protein
MDEKIQEHYENFLNPAILRQRLIIGSLSIAAFEVLKTSIIARIKDFFTDWDTVDPKYQAEVLSKDRSPVYASLAWLKEMNAISDDDVAVFNQVKDFRNEVAHEIIRMVAEEFPPYWEERFTDLISLVDKIERWWVVNYEIPINPDFDGQEIDEEGIIPGPVAWLKIMLTVALGNEEEASYYFNEIIKYRKPSISDPQKRS